MSPWSSGFENERRNLTSLIGTLTQKREGKKNRRAQLLSDIMGIGSQFGGALLQNKLGKDAEQRKYAQEVALRQADRESARQERTAADWRQNQGVALEHGYRMQELAARLAGEKDVARIRESEGQPEYGAVYSFVNTFLNDVWGPANGILNRDGTINIAAMTPEKIAQFTQDAIIEGRAVPGITANDIRGVIQRRFPAQTPEPGPGPKGEKTDKGAARAEERQKREVLLSEVKAMLQTINQIPNGRTTQPAMAINAGMLNLYTQNSTSLSRILEQLSQAQQQLSQKLQTPANPVQEQMQQILKAGVPGMPKMNIPSTGSKPLDLSKIRF